MPTPLHLEVLADSAARVFLRRVYEAGDPDLTPMVYCPRSEDAVALDACRGCESCLGISIDRSDRATFLRCTFEPALGVPVQRGPVPDGGPGQPGGTIADIMVSPVRTVSTDATLAEAAALFVTHGVSAAPVVDREGRPVGVISKTDIVNRCYEGGDLGAVADAWPREHDLPDEPGMHVEEPDPTRVDGAMTPVVLSVPTDAPIARAAALMAYEAVHHLLVHDPEGRMVGIVSSLDVMGWLARRDGFVVPARAGDNTDREEQP